MRKVLLLLVVSFIIMGTLGAHAIIPDSATVEVPTPESDYVQDTDVQSENFAEPEQVVVEPALDEVTEQSADEVVAIDSETTEEMVAESINDVDVEPEPIAMESVVDEIVEQVTDEMSAVDSEQVEETAVVETFNDVDVELESSVEPEVYAEPEPVIVETDVVDIPEHMADELSAADSEASEETVVESINDAEAESEPVIMEPSVDEVTEQTSDELSDADSEATKEMVVESFNDVDVELESSVEPEVYAEPEPVAVEPSVDEVTEQVADELHVVDSEASEETVVESINDAEAKPEPVVMEPAVVEVTEQVSDEMSVVDSEAPEEKVAESINDAEAEPESVVVESVMDEVTEQTADELAIVDSEQGEETAVVETFNDVDVELGSSVESEVYAEPESVVVEPLVDEVTEQPADELSAADPEQAESLLVETEDVAEDVELEQTPYAEEMEKNVAETEVSEPVVADSEPIVDDIEDVQTVMDIVPDEGNDNDMESVDVQAEEDEPLVESDESDKKSGINGKVLLSMEATHFAWNFSSNGGGYGLALPCSGVSAEWLFSNRFACGFDVRVSTESDGTSYRTNLGILNRFGMLSSVKNFLNEANVVFFKGDVLLGLTIKDAVGGIATLPTIGLGGSVHFGRDFLTMAFGVDGMVMFPLSGADRTPVFSIRPNMALTWIL